MTIVFFSVAFITGLLTGMVEILSRYRDEPFKTVGSSRFSWFYLILNGLLGIFAYWILLETSTDISNSDSLEHIWLAVLGGLGAAVVIRSRIFSAKIGDEEVAIGPGYIVDQLLSVLDRHIDRDRALARTRIVLEKMTGIDFFKAHPYFSTMILGSTQNLSLQEQKVLAARVLEINAQEQTTVQQKAFALGFVILDFMGEEFLTVTLRKASELGLSLEEEIEAEISFGLETTKLVRSHLNAVKYSEAKQKVETYLESANSLTEQQRQKIRTLITSTDVRGDSDQNKSYAIGFGVLDVCDRKTFASIFPTPRSQTSSDASH